MKRSELETMNSQFGNQDRKDNDSQLIETVGWVGAFLILVAYFLNSGGIVDSDNIWYQLMNLVGAIGLLVISYFEKAYQPVLVNVVWMGISIVALVNILLN